MADDTIQLVGVVVKCSDGGVRQVLLDEGQHEQMKLALVAIAGRPVRVSATMLPLEIEDMRARKAVAK
jgi:hypothetical protein